MSNALPLWLEIRPMTMMSPEPPLTRSSGISTDARSLLIACLVLAVIGFAFFHYWCRCAPWVGPHIASAQVGPPPAGSTPWKDPSAEPRDSRLPGGLDNVGTVPAPKGPTICPWAHDRAVDGELPRDYSVNCPHWQRWTHDPAYDVPHRYRPHERNDRELEILEAHVHHASY
jgi:hypothetical protein